MAWDKIRAGWNIVQDKLKKASLKIAWAAKQPKCSKCDATTKHVVGRHQARNPDAFAIGNLVGICPKCRKAFCVDHCVKANPHDWFSNEQCPEDKADLDFHWDEPPSEDKPWRIGPAPGGNKN